MSDIDEVKDAGNSVGGNIISAKIDIKAHFCPFRTKTIVFGIIITENRAFYAILTLKKTF